MIYDQNIVSISFFNGPYRDSTLIELGLSDFKSVESSLNLTSLS